MAFERLLVALEGVQQIAAIVVRLGIIGPQRNGAIEARQRVVAAPQSVEHIAAVGMRFDEIRPQRDRPVVARQRFVITLERIQRDAAIDQRLDIIGPYAERPVIALERVAEALHLLEGIAAIVERQNVMRRDFKSVADLPNRGRWIAALHEDDAEQMQAVEMPRLARQNMLIDLLGFRQLPGLMQL